MSWNEIDREDTTNYKVVINHEEQYSIWPEHKENPAGWKEVGKAGPKEECLAFIKEAWTDMRPLSLRRKMEELAKNPPSFTPAADPELTREESLVDRLTQGEHPIEVALRPERTAKLFKEAIDRNYAHIRFTDTRGGTELGVSLEAESCDFSKADFERGVGSVHLVGSLTLDYVRVKCVADIDLNTLEGKGRLLRAEAAEQV